MVICPLQLAVSLPEEVKKKALEIRDSLGKENSAEEPDRGDLA
jgi:hypothetical protein